MGYVDRNGHTEALMSGVAKGQASLRYAKRTEISVDAKVPVHGNALGDLLTVEVLIDALSDLNDKSPEEDVSLYLEDDRVASFERREQPNDD